MTNWTLSLLPSKEGQSAQSKSKRRRDDQTEDLLTAAKRARRVAQRKERLRMFGLHSVEGWTEEDFQPDMLQSTAEQLLVRGVLAVEDGDHEKALEFFRTGALSRSVTSMIELARSLLFGALHGIPSDADAASVMLQVAKKQSHVSPGLFEECDQQTAELTLAKAAVAENDLQKMVSLLGSRNEESLEMIADALADMANDKEGLKAIADCQGSLEKLTALLGSKNIDVLRPAVSVFADLTADDESRSAVAALPSSLERLVALLRSKYIRVQNLSPTGRKPIATTPHSLERLVGLLDTEDAYVPMQTARALGNLACNAENRKAIAAVPGSLEAVTRLLSNKNQEVQEWAAFALANLAAGNRRNRERIAAESGVWEALADLMGSKSARIQEEATRALAELVVDSANVKAFAAVPGSVERIVRLSSSNNLEVQRDTSKVLVNLGKDEEIEKLIAKLEGHSDDEAERLQEEEQSAKRLRIIGLFNNEECTEEHFEPDRLQSTAEVLFSKGVLARERGEDADAFEFFRMSAVAGSANSMIEMARYFLAGTVCSKDVIAAQALLRAASKHSFVDSELLQDCEDKTAEMANARLPAGAAFPKILELLCTLDSERIDAQRSAKDMLFELARNEDSIQIHWLVRLLGSENEILQEVVADVVSDLAEGEEDGPGLGALPGLLERLLDLLMSARARATTMIMAAVALENLAVDAKNRDKILAVPRSLECLTTLLWGRSALTLQNAAADVLYNLAQGSKASTVLSAIASGPETLRKLANLLNGRPGLKSSETLGAWALASLALDTETGKAIAAIPGSLEGLVRLLGKDNTGQVQEQAARALANLALESSNSRAIARAPGAVACLVPLLSSPSAGARMRAARALVNLTCEVENKPRVANTPGTLDALARLLSCKSAVLQKFGAWALGNLAHGPKLKAQIVAVPGCLCGLVGLLGSRKAKVKGYAARALANLAIGAANKKAIAEVRGALEALVRLEGSYDAEVRGQAKRALKNLAGMKQNRVKINAARLGGGALLKAGCP
ncbi:hypothetical protein KFL_000490260 [Klebsormidium nitens]|uniref:Vacuolar protein 8 n=1 Tax=Klebsormidium nitens TaxID=105231 RepID=A0A0U9HK71_KLENI|nr:hypothetical protein KFL_000490260 [Klebsormidium nitens]|eukprot:GAQ80236.1 hypothetical protein KFL_000490260 [Klebsormidium nitens]